MNLDTQIITLVFSLLYGCFFCLTLSVSYKIIYNTSFIFKLIGTFIFVLFHVLLYFLVLQKINYGIVHIYSVLCLIVGYIITYNVQKHLVSMFTIFRKK